MSDTGDFDMMLFLTTVPASTRDLAFAGPWNSKPRLSKGGWHVPVLAILQWIEQSCGAYLCFHEAEIIFLFLLLPFCLPPLSGPFMLPGFWLHGIPISEVEVGNQEQSTHVSVFMLLSALR